MPTLAAAKNDKPHEHFRKSYSVDVSSIALATARTDKDWVVMFNRNFDTSSWMELYEIVHHLASDGRELFGTGLKYLNKLIENTWGTKKNFKSNILMIHKILPKFMKILSYEYLEPYGGYYKV